MISSIQFYPDLPSFCPGFTECNMHLTVMPEVLLSEAARLLFSRSKVFGWWKFSTKEQMCSISPCLKACLSACLSLLPFPRGNTPVRKGRNGCKGHWVPIRSTSLNPISAQFMPLCFGNGGVGWGALCWLGKEKKTLLTCPMLILLVKQKCDRTL